MSANQRESIVVERAVGADDFVADNPLTLRMIKNAVDAVDEETLLNAPVLRLGWLGITEIDHLELFTSCKDLYLQHNKLCKTTGLESLRDLEFLALGNNRITHIEGLRNLKQLQVLDVSNNRIAEIRETDLPPSIRIINVRGNPFASDPKHRKHLLQMLPECICIDDIDVTEEERAAITDERDAGQSNILADDTDDFAAELEKDLNDAVATEFGSSVAEVKAEPRLAAAAVDILDAYDRYSAQRADARNKFNQQVQMEVAAMHEMIDGLTKSSGDALAHATERMRSIREAISSRAEEREASIAESSARVIAQFKAIGAAASGEDQSSSSSS